jgi:hypothetical protein
MRLRFATLVTVHSLTEALPTRSTMTLIACVALPLSVAPRLPVPRARSAHLLPRLLLSRPSLCA